MTRFAVVLGLLALGFLLLLLPAPAGAQAQVRIVSPPANQPLFGEIEIRADVRGAPVSRVEIYLDGIRIGVVESPPWRMLIDVGQRNQEHTIEVLAYGASGSVGSAVLRTLPLQVDEEIDVGLQQLYVIVERGGRRVTDLVREDFVVLDDGAPQPLATFELGEIPFTAVLLLDASTSMAGSRLRTAADGAKSFVAGMTRLDEAKLMLFSDSILLETPFTSVPSILSLGLSNVEPRGGTALNDAIYLALKRLEGSQGRRVVVLLSDGIDIESILGMEQVQAIARRTHAVLYWLRLKRYNEDAVPFVDIFTAWRDAEGHRRQIDLLRSTVLESGGRIETLDSLEQVKPALETLLRELRDQYVLGYDPSGKKGSGTWHDLELRIRPERGTGYQIRTQEGYVEK